ncbi:MAG TPA: glycosyl hydrolase family 18 protein, partial [Edaphobacter sp.]|nr:glycosyl hydrolase family 18 protein [Edaphobacter sp.]
MHLSALRFSPLTLVLALFCCVSAPCSTPELSSASQDSPTSREIIAYVFPQDRVLSPGEINARRLTRINYAFANIKNGEVVEGFPHDAENFAILNTLKRNNPALKLLVSVGGWTWSGGFSDAALTPRSRERFISSAVRFIERHKLDGLDIDWEYPDQPGSGNTFRPQDKQNYTLLLAELRQRFDREQTRLHRPLY